MEDKMDADKVKEFLKICLAGENRCGTIDGIEIDLRHKELPSNWRPHLFGLPPGVFSARNTGAPWIWFPWFGDYSSDLPRKWAERDLKNSPAKKTSKNSGKSARTIDELTDRLRPEIIVNPGDRIIIAGVAIVSIGDKYDYLDDQEVRHAHLQIVRADSQQTVENVKTPLTFRRTQSLSWQGSPQLVFARRICKQFEITSLDQTPPSPAKAGENARAALAAARKVETATAESKEIFFKAAHLLSPESDKAHTQLKLVNDAILMGYFWARAESDLQMKPLAEQLLRQRSKGGKARGETLTRDADQWKKKAAEKILSVRKQRPHLTNSKIAGEVQNSWGGTASRRKFP
jgi:hypothetical protein